jgi:hypothetical protein
MKINLFFVSVVVDRHPKSIFENKKILNPDPSPSGPDLGVEEGGRLWPHREGGGAIGRSCRSRSHRLGRGPPEPSALVPPWRRTLEELAPVPPWRRT